MPTKIKPFLILDAFRGIACLWVIAFHMAEVMIARYPQLGANPLYRLTAYGNSGVQMFFVISGYCIASAMSGALRKDSSVLYFLKARVRRIYPTAAIAITFGLLYSTFASALVSHGLVASSTAAEKSVWSRGLEYFLVNYTLTNGVFPTDFVLVQCWTLCYEVAFYLFVGLALAAFGVRYGEKSVLTALHALTVAALIALIVNPHCLRYPLDLWPEFGLGVIVYDLIRTRYDKATIAWAAAAVAATLALILFRDTPLGTMGVSSRTQFAISLAFAALVLACYRYDAKIAAAPICRGLAAIGLYSYSLYLTHTFSIGIISQVFKRFHLPMTFHYAVFVLVMIGAVLFGRVFFQFFEKPFISTKAKKIHHAALESASETARVSEPVAAAISE
ncbi:LPS biosynthesis protein [Capsulimonas corticalis]|uniref:LPS biosynthesis protein n=1 Tax=Capsulimonas corticalis TaxID=2219043 RepID=A0A402CPF3_9BACT|nr:acyltransferase [Capsulimonas corticalis]BDI33115.1 LPS biosynthesis protein [Capsulimonas corticalis]